MSDEEASPDRDERDEEIIQEAKRLVRRSSRSQIRLGKLALEFSPMGERGHRTGSFARTEMFADKVGISAATIRLYRSVTHAWSVTDIEDGEFSFDMLQTLIRVADKEGLLKELRAAKPQEGLLTTKDAMDIAVKKDYWEAGGSGPPRRGTGGNTNVRRREFALREIGDSLRKMSFKNIPPEKREILDPHLARVEAEAARLRQELSQIKAVA